MPDSETPQATSTASVVLSSAVSFSNRYFFGRCSSIVQSKLVVLRSLAVFLQRALSIVGNESSSPESTWYMSSAFASARAHRSFDALFEPSLMSGPSKVVWKSEAMPSEEQFVGAFPLVDAGMGDGFSLQELSGLQSTVSTESGSTSTRLKHISVRFSLIILSRTH